MKLDSKKIVIGLSIVLFSHLQAQLPTKSKLDFTLGPSIANLGLYPNKNAIFLPGFNTGITIYDRWYLNYFNSSVRTRSDDFGESSIQRYPGFNFNCILSKPQNKVRFILGVTTYKTVSSVIRNDSVVYNYSGSPHLLPTIGLRLKLNEKLKLDVHYNGFIGSLGLTYRLATVEVNSKFNKSTPLKIN